MKKQILTLLLILFKLVNGISQDKSDYLWMFGADIEWDTIHVVKGSQIDFNRNARLDTTIRYVTLTQNNTSICDKEGRLMFYFNGCRVIDSTEQIMLNGDSINYGVSWDKYCGKFDIYPGFQNSIILPDPGNEKDGKNGYYLIHKKITLVNVPYLHSYIPELYYSYIDMNKNDGKGEVIKKNISIFKTTNIVNGYLTACKHANGKDWWMVQMERDTNIYFKILLTKDSIAVIDSQSMGSIFTPDTNVAQAKFTPDGSKWLMYNIVDHAIIYDFDRATGELSNMRIVDPQDSAQFTGLAVSSNSRFAYLSAKWDLYQIDLWADNIQESLVHIDHIDGFRDPTFKSTFGQAQLAPDCKIYIVPSITNRHVHVINKPNEKGKACDFRQHSIALLAVNFNNCLPNFPHFRIDEDQICDSTITWIPDEYIVKSINVLSVYPNPAPDKATISVYSDGFEHGIIRIFDITGQLVRSMDIDSEATRQLDVSKMVPGVYAVEYVSYVSGGRDVRKLVVK